MAFTRTQLQQHAAGERARYEDLLRRFVEVPSVSADPARKPDVERCAELGAETLRAFGARAELHRVAGGNPVVLGSFETGGDRPTVLVYNHLDVQPASKESEPWRSEPFVFTREGDTYFGRGTTDDKGPALAALFGARAALDAGVPVNVKFLWELEEEIGSPHFAETLQAIGAAASADAVVVSDTVWVSRARPSLSAGLRGLQRITFHLETAETDQHSGTTGGAARNPVAELCQLAAEIFDARTGRVKIPGFYDDVAKLTRQELKDFEAAGFSVRGFIKDHGFKSIRTKDPLEVMKRLWALPTFEVHGLVGGYTGPGVKTVVPPRAELKCSVRLVPEMKGDKVVKLVKAFVKRRNPDVRVEGGSSRRTVPRDHHGPVRRGREARRPLRLRQGTGVRARGRHDRRRALDGADPEAARSCSWACRCRTTATTRPTRTSTGARRAAGSWPSRGSSRRSRRASAKPHSAIDALSLRGGPLRPSIEPERFPGAGGTEEALHAGTQDLPALRNAADRHLGRRRAVLGLRAGAAAANAERGPCARPGQPPNPVACPGPASRAPGRGHGPGGAHLGDAGGAAAPGRRAGSGSPASGSACSSRAASSSTTWSRSSGWYAFSNLAHSRTSLAARRWSLFRGHRVDRPHRAPHAGAAAAPEPRLRGRGGPRHLHRRPPRAAARPGVPLAPLSWLCVWIVVFPLFVPASPRWALLAGAAAATHVAARLPDRPRAREPAVPAASWRSTRWRPTSRLAVAMFATVVIRGLQELGCYQLVEKLDHGGMGEIWRARHRMLARPVAVKLIRPELLGVKSAARGRRPRRPIPARGARRPPPSTRRTRSRSTTSA